MPQSPKNKWILYLILVVLFIYWYAAFHVDYLPLHSFFQDFYSNYDNYASKAIGYVPLIIALIIALSFFLRSIKKDFLKLQSTLPTSKIQDHSQRMAETRKLAKQKAQEADRKRREAKQIAKEKSSRKGKNTIYIEYTLEEIKAMSSAKRRNLQDRGILPKGIAV